MITEKRERGEMEIQERVLGNIITRFMKDVKSRISTKFSKSKTAIKNNAIFSKIGAKAIIFYTLQSFIRIIIRIIASILRTLWRVLCAIKKKNSMKENSEELFKKLKNQIQENLRLKSELNEIKKEVKELNGKSNGVTQKFEQARSKINLYEDPSVLVNLDIETVLRMEKKIQFSIQEIAGLKAKVVKQSIKLLSLLIYR